MRPCDDGVVARQLLIVRHAKSAWDDPGIDDHDRPLAPRGEKALDRMGRHLADVASPPEVVLCSTAHRAVATLAGVRSALPSDAEVQYEHDLYLAGAAALVDRLQRIDETVASAMIVGHNPGLHDLALLLAESGDPELVTRLEATLPTGAIATIEFPEPWSDIGHRSGRLVGLFTPRPPRSGVR